MAFGTKQPAIVNAPSMCSPASVLVVDDDDFIRALLRRVFTDAGLKVETFASAADLLARADLRSHAVLLLDMAMPDMSGLELQALLRQRGVTLPVIFLTGSSDIAQAVVAMRNGAVDFLEKPFHADILIDRVRHALALDAKAPYVARASGNDYARRLHTLTVREREVMDLMITGKTSKMIAQDLGGSFRTIEIHRTRVMSKMAAASLADLVRMAFDAEAGA